MKPEGLAKVDLKRGVDLDCFDELGTRVHDDPDKPKGVGNVGLEKGEDVVGCRWVFERGKVDGHPRQVCVCKFLASHFDIRVYEPRFLHFMVDGKQQRP